MDELRSLSFKDAPNIVVTPPGPKAKALLEEQKEIESSATIRYPLTMPLAIDEGKGATVKDVDGNVYIDFFAGIAVLPVGYSNPYVLEAVERQQKKLIHALDFPNVPRANLVKKLREIAPGGLRGTGKVVFGGPTGSDANEAAIKIAKIYSGNKTLIVFEGSYHGQTSTSLAMSSSTSGKDKLFPLTSGVHFVPYPYCYRCPFGLSYDGCGLACVDYLEHVLTDPYSGVIKPAAIMVEPVQGEGGIIVPPPEFLPRIRKICDGHGIPMVIDEIQSGFGRTGKMFACEHWGVTPDIMPMAKALGGVGLPLSGVMISEEIEEKVYHGAHLGTFRGHVLGMTAGLAGIEYIEKHDLVKHAAEMGDYILARFNELKEEVDAVGDVRGKGLMLAMEMVKDRRSKEPAPELAGEVKLECFRKGLLIWSAGHFANVIRFLPAMILDKELADKGLEIFEKELKKACK